jgi:hypothetical protein
MSTPFTAATALFPANFFTATGPTSIVTSAAATDKVYIKAKHSLQTTHGFVELQINVCTGE